MEIDTDDFKIRQALISIKPEYIEKIFNRVKHWELRKQNINANHFIVYATAPVKMVVGQFFCDEIIIDNPEHFYSRFSWGLGIKRKDFDAYFAGKERCYAHHIHSPQLFPKPLPITHYGLKRPPQSFCYLKQEIEA